MKFPVKVWRESRLLMDVDVDFPMFRKQVVGRYPEECVIYSRVDRPVGSFLTVEVRESEQFDRKEKDFEIRSLTAEDFEEQGMDYSLGLGRFACTKAEFDAALARAIDFAQRLV